MAGLMTRTQFAEHMGVNKSTVSRWISNGRISINAKGLIDPDAARRSLEATESPEPHHQARIAQIAEEKARSARVAAADGPGMPPMEKIGAALKLETYKLRKADAEIRAMERDKLAGTLGETARFEYVMRDVGMSLRSMLESLPDRIAPVLASHRGDVNAIHASMDDAIHDLLHEIHDLFQRKAKQIEP